MGHPPRLSPLVDLQALPEMPDKIEGVTAVDEFGEDGRHIGSGSRSQLLVIAAPVP